MFGNNKKTDELIKKYNSQLDRRLEQLKEARQNMKDNNKMGATLNTIRDLLRTYNSQQDRDVSPRVLNPKKVPDQDTGERHESPPSSTEYCDDPSKEGEEFCDPTQKPQARDRDSSKPDLQPDQPSSLPRAMKRFKRAAETVRVEQGVVNQLRDELVEHQRLEDVVEDWEEASAKGATSAAQKLHIDAGETTSDQPGIRDPEEEEVDDLPNQSP